MVKIFCFEININFKDDCNLRIKNYKQIVGMTLDEAQRKYSDYLFLSQDEYHKEQKTGCGVKLPFKIVYKLDDNGKIIPFGQPGISCRDHMHEC